MGHRVSTSRGTKNASETVPASSGRRGLRAGSVYYSPDGEANQMTERRFCAPSKELYDYDRSTKDNHTQETEEWTGPHADIRAKMDHEYHGFYAPERQALQDDMIGDVIGGGTVHRGGDGPWCVFTAGAMGAGKGYVMRWLSRQGYFPLPDVVQIDPDNFKDALPEWLGYVEADRLSAGFHTRRETGYMVEVAQEAALRLGKNVWVDGSLRDKAWYALVFADLRVRFPDYRLAILYVDADRDVVRRRSLERGAATGREVPQSELDDSLIKTPLSVASLRKLVDFTAYIKNNPGRSPVLAKTCIFDEETIVSPDSENAWTALSDRFRTAPQLVQRSNRQSLRCAMENDLRSVVNGSPVVVFSKTYCTFCNKAKSVLLSTMEAMKTESAETTGDGAPSKSQVVAKMHVVELDEVPEGVALQVELSMMTDVETVPQVFVHGKFLGGCDRVLELEREGKLQELLAGKELPAVLE